MRTLAILLVSVLCVSGMRSAVWAGPNARARVVAHVMPAQKGLPVAPPLGGYEDIVTEAPEPGTYDVALYVADPSAEDGVAGVEFAIDFDRRPAQGIDLVTERWLGDLAYEWADWPGPESYVTLTWDRTNDCRYEQFIPFAAIRVEVHGPDVLRIVPSPRSSGVLVAECGLRTSEYPWILIDGIPEEQVGRIGFVGMEGYNPGPAVRTPTPAEPVSWGRLKTLYH